MVGLGFFIALFFPLVWFLARRKMLEKCKTILYFSLLLIPLTYLSSELGWAVAEVGRQPWIVYEILPTKVAASATSATIVGSIFFGFLIIFTLLLIAALRIAINQIKIGPKIAEKETSTQEEDEDSDIPPLPKSTPRKTTAAKTATTKTPTTRAKKTLVKKTTSESDTEKPAPRKRTPKKQAE